MEEVSELETRKIENPFNKHFQRHFHVNEYNDVVIKGIMPRMILSKKEQKKLMVEVGLLNIKNNLVKNQAF